MLFSATNFTFRESPVMFKTRALRLAILKRQLPYPAMLYQHPEGNSSFCFCMEYPGTLPCRSASALSGYAWAERKEKEPACSKISSLVILRVPQLAASWKAFPVLACTTVKPHRTPCASRSQRTLSEMRHTSSRLDSRNPTVLRSAESHVSSPIHTELAL